MKKLPITLLILTFLNLNWSAFDDMTTGNEPNYLGEYTIIFISFTILGYYAGKSVHLKAFELQKRITRNTFLKHYHFHHSLTGILLSLIGLLINPK